MCDYCENRNKGIASKRLASKVKAGKNSLFVYIEDSQLIVNYTDANEQTKVTIPVNFCCKCGERFQQNRGFKLWGSK